MLVLTRRKDQKVLFPCLGISVEVVGVSGKSVRLGIDAPPEIRVVRDEIEPFDDGSRYHQAFSENQARSVDHTALNSGEIQKRLDAANLAIHLAQNQLQQGLNDNADDAMDHAVECLRQIEEFLANNNPGSTKPSDNFAVRESQTNYGIRPNVASLDPAQRGQPVALVFGEHCEHRHILEKQLIRQGYNVTQAPDTASLIDLMINHPRPALALMTGNNFQSKVGSLESIFGGTEDWGLKLSPNPGWAEDLELPVTCWVGQCKSTHQTVST